MAGLATFWIYLISVCISGGNAQMVQMDATKTGYVGSQVELRCLFVNSNPPVKISQVTWQKFLNGTKQNVAIANPTMGVSVLPPFKDRVTFKHSAVKHRTPSLEDTTIIFSNLRLSDEAAYICEYTTFPAGNRENMVNLTVLARPVTRMSLSTPTIVARASSQKMTVATCLSANGKPPGVISWETRLKGEAETEEIRNPNGTVTVRSNYVVVPSRETHKQTLTCVVTYYNERIADSVVLSVQYEPEITIEGFDGNWYLNRQDVKLICKTDANPPVSVYHWKMLNGSMPTNAEIRNNTLFFKGPVTYNLAGTYICDATNSIGTRSGLVEVNVTEFPNIPPREIPQESRSSGAIIGGAVGGVVLLALAAIVLIVVLRRRQRTFKEKPLPQGAPGGFIGILGIIVAAGLIIGVAVTVFVVYRRQQKTHTETDNDMTDLPPAHKPAPPPPKKKNTDFKCRLTSEDIQHPGKHYEELPNTADYVSYRLACNKEDCIDPRSPPVYPPLTYLPQNPYTHLPSSNPALRYPASGSITPFTFPKEQYV